MFYYCLLLILITIEFYSVNSTPLRQLFINRVETQLQLQQTNLLETTANIKTTANPKEKARCDRIFNQYLLKCVAT